MFANGHHDGNKHDPVEYVDDDKRKNESKIERPFSRTTAA